MKIRYYCPECRKLSILNAIYTAEKRVCAWCGVTIHSEHVKHQSHPKLQRKLFHGPLWLVGIVVFGCGVIYCWHILFFPSDSVLLKRSYIDWWLTFFFGEVMCLWGVGAAWCGFNQWYSDDKDWLLDMQRKENKERAADQK